jgi:DNA-binding HxlR family transcriptional regulator
LASTTLGAGLTVPTSASETEVYFDYQRARSRKHVTSQDPPPSSPPTLALLDLLGRRWALRILWELRAGPLSFQRLQARCDSMSTSVLSQRLTELRDSQLVERDPRGAYALTEQGSLLLARLDGIDDWTRQWWRLLRHGQRSGDASRAD